jgi:cyclophilin family peptidyl-prolyl cis-trans isomerase
MNSRASSVPPTVLVLFLLSVALFIHVSIAATTNPVVLMQTSMGDIKIELYADKAPITVRNFLDYARLGFYNNTLFHRVLYKFMIQGGGVTSDLKEKTTRAPIKNEATNGLSNLRGTIAMARENEPNSATSQFFINLVDNKRLDHTRPGGKTFGYAVFGKVIEGMEVVDKIGTTPTKRVSAEYVNVPMTPVVIKAVRIILQ